MTTTMTAAITAMEQAAPDRVLEGLRGCLTERVDAVRVELLLPDYHLATLHPMAHPERQVRVDGTWEGRIFAAQRYDVRAAPSNGNVELGVPVTVRGDRRGVLVVELPTGPHEEVVDELLAVAEALGRAILLADRLTDIYARVRRAKPLTVAAELQWQLLPGVSFVGPGFTIAAQLEPAYSVAGDSYDWSFDGSTLSLVACDGAGRGVPASLAASIVLAALRNARRADLPLTDQAALGDQAVYAHFGGERFVSAQLIQLDVASGRLTIVDAGSPALWLMRGGELTHVAMDGQLPMGMFEETHYDAHSLVLEPGDRIVVLSDGVSAEREGKPGLAIENVLRGTRLLAADEAVRHVMRELATHHENNPLDDDAVVLCLDWAGPVTPPGLIALS